jgi:hypothetical protein
MDIPRIYMVDIHGISMDIPRISTPLDIRGISMNVPRISHVYRSGRHIHGIYVVYTRHIPKIGVPDVVTVRRGHGASGPMTSYVARIRVQMIFSDSWFTTPSLSELASDPELIFSKCQWGPSGRGRSPRDSRLRDDCDFAWRLDAVTVTVRVLKPAHILA